jgi:hypothetical protein
LLLTKEPEHVVPVNLFFCCLAAVFHGYAVPGGGFLVVALCSFAFFVHAGNLFGGLGVSAVGGAQVPVECAFIALLYIVAIFIELREPVLCIGVAEFGGLLVIAYGALLA